MKATVHYQGSYSMRVSERFASSALAGKIRNEQ